MKATTKLIGTILTAAALVGFSGAGAAMAASSTERPTTDTAVVTTTSWVFQPQGTKAAPATHSPASTISASAKS